ncbi:hypothetical protein [Novosphingobium soli]
MTPFVTLPANDLERLVDLAARQQGVNDGPTLMLFATVRLLIEQARQRR